MEKYQKMTKFQIVVPVTVIVDGDEYEGLDMEQIKARYPEVEMRAMRRAKEMVEGVLERKIVEDLWSVGNAEAAHEFQIKTDEWVAE